MFVSCKDLAPLLIMPYNTFRYFVYTAITYFVYLVLHCISITMYHYYVYFLCHLPFVYVYIVKLPHRSMTFWYLYSINNMLRYSGWQGSVDGQQ